MFVTLTYLWPWPWPTPLITISSPYPKSQLLSGFCAGVFGGAINTPGDTIRTVVQKRILSSSRWLTLTPRVVCCSNTHILYTQLQTHPQQQQVINPLDWPAVVTYTCYLHLFICIIHFLTAARFSELDDRTIYSTPTNPPWFMLLIPLAFLDLCYLFDWPPPLINTTIYVTNPPSFIQLTPSDTSATFLGVGREIYKARGLGGLYAGNIIAPLSNGSVKSSHPSQIIASQSNHRIPVKYLIRPIKSSHPVQIFGCLVNINTPYQQCIPTHASSHITSHTPYHCSNTPSTLTSFMFKAFHL